MAALLALWASVCSTSRTKTLADEKYQGEEKSRNNAVAVEWKYHKDWQLDDGSEWDSLEPAFAGSIPRTEIHFDVTAKMWRLGEWKEEGSAEKRWRGEEQERQTWEWWGCWMGEADGQKETDTTQQRNTFPSQLPSTPRALWGLPLLCVLDFFFHWP